MKLLRFQHFERALIQLLEIIIDEFVSPVDFKNDHRVVDNPTALKEKSIIFNRGENLQFQAWIDYHILLYS